jgi:Fur family ferric uptake transcriptional regulator
MSMEKETKLLLKKHGLSITEGRLRILELFLRASGALSHGDVENAGGEKFDRVTVYRTLQVFEEKGVIHAIPTADNSVRYALCKETCNEEHHHDNHVHFVCDVCGQTVCLESITVPAVTLPKGFLPGQVQMIVNGTCNLCQEREAKRGTRNLQPRSK